MAGEKKQLLDVLMTAIAQSLADVHTSTIARVTKVGTNLIACKPVISRIVDGEVIQLPEFVDVPVLVLQGGGSYTAYPVAVGDYALLVFTERCFDRWWNGQDDQPPAELRMHDYSDGIALVGLNPLSSLIPIPDTIKQVGDTVQEGDYTHTGDRVQTGNQTVNGNLVVNGNLTVNGDIACTGTLTVPTISAANVSASTGVTIAGLDFGTHRHTESGGGTTGGPI